MTEGKRQEAKVHVEAPAGSHATDTAKAREEDRVLVQRAKAGDRAAFSTLLRRYERRVFSVANAMLRNQDDAKDVCQEAFWKAHNALPSFDGEAQFFTWMYRITVNLAIDYLRKRRGERVEFDDARANGEAADPTGISPRRLGLDPGRALDDHELRAHLQEALQKLSPAHRTVLVLREVEGLSYQEMADVVGCSIGTIMSRLFHARKKMQALLLEARGADAVPPVAPEGDEEVVKGSTS
jgi:RNA polymerase sigma-70 factor (ECF subfamily)